MTHFYLDEIDKKVVNGDLFGFGGLAIFMIICAIMFTYVAVSKKQIRYSGDRNWSQRDIIFFALMSFVAAIYFLFGRASPAYNDLKAGGVYITAVVEERIFTGSKSIDQIKLEGDGHVYQLYNKNPKCTAGKLCRFKHYKNLNYLYFIEVMEKQQPKNSKPAYNKLNGAINHAPTNSPG